MDPNATLARIRDLTDDSELSELIQALDSWISSGGFLPSAWEHAR